MGGNHQPLLPRKATHATPPLTQAHETPIRRTCKPPWSNSPPTMSARQNRRALPATNPNAAAIRVKSMRSHHGARVPPLF